MLVFWGCVSRCFGCKLGTLDGILLRLTALGLSILLQAIIGIGSLIIVTTLLMIVHILLIGIHRILQLGGFKVEGIYQQAGLLDVDIVRIAVDKQLEGRFRLAGDSILPVAVYLLQHLQMRLDRIAMGHRGINIHIQEVLQHSGLRAHHRILIGPHFILLL